ncbi:hypothetical protein NDU88_003676 [Pleurodeles waltl]|uniref:Uncharacterized protein n=1 Tax=Pleurodeles waltl TaxID=8319 RepID=A0AAV7LFZ7_PLEWA|nr:hypothetical protein NDU88_003676 [Pleurodeles waltl]
MLIIARTRKPSTDSRMGRDWRLLLLQTEAGGPLLRHIQSLQISCGKLSARFYSVELMFRSGCAREEKAK